MNSTELIDIIQQEHPFKIALGNSKCKNDIIVKSSDREDSKEKIKNLLLYYNIEYKEIFKGYKSGSVNVLSIVQFKYDIVFKPLVAKGSGGISFEKEIQKSFEEWIQDEPIQKHQEIVQHLEEIGYKREQFEGVSHDGGKNQKRKLQFDGEKFFLTNSNGETLTDVTLIKRNQEKLFCSLKMSHSYFLLNSSIINFFKDPETRRKSYEFFGLDGNSMKGFGEEYYCECTRYPEEILKENLSRLLSDAYGSGYVLIHKNEDDFSVKELREPPKIQVREILSTLYPEDGKRKSASIKTLVQVDDKRYRIDFQFRGTRANDISPKYLRILLRPLKN